jgi:FlaA1/EpsC-like NDP-sugar epimerase
MMRRNKSLNFFILVALDLALVLLAHVLAYLTRFEAGIPEEHISRMLSLMPMLAVVKMACFFFFNLYKGMWRYTSLPDLFNVIKASVVASLLIVAYLAVAERFEGYSRSVFMLDWLYTTLFVSGLRMGIRIFYGAGMVSLPEVLKPRDSKGRKPVVLLGAGGAGEMIIRENAGDPRTSVKIVAIFDDDPNKQGRILHGLPILGPMEILPRWVREDYPEVQEALIAIPTISGQRLREIVALCEESGLAYRRIPSISEIARGSVSIKDLRDVDYKDLLGREQADLDIRRISGYLRGAVVLVTGAGGSIGSELCRQIIPFVPEKLLLLDSSEYGLYSLQMELEHEKGFSDYEVLLGNLRDEDWTKWVIEAHSPDVVFHAAAYKHVPLLECNEAQAVLNNVLPTSNLVASALSAGVGRLLIVSTDKAVRPTNVMGASKRLTELIMQAHCGRGTRLMAVRFGNVIGSAGSVIPLFRSQIEHGGPVTVTHPEVVRYFMTIEEACKLILQAGSMGEGGEIFVLKMGQPVRIADMARDLIRLSGKEPERDIEIKYIGLRPGEKLYEELITEDENVAPTEHEQIMVLQGEGCAWDGLAETIEALRKAAESGDSAQIRRILRRAVPEYHSTD